MGQIIFIENKTLTGTKPRKVNVQRKQQAQCNGDRMLGRSNGE